MMTKKWYKNSWQYPAIFRMLVRRRENRTSVTREDRDLAHRMTFRHVASNGADFSPPLRFTGDEKFPFDLTAVNSRERKRKFTLSHRTHSPSITAAVVSFRGDETADVLSRKAAGCRPGKIFRARHLSN